MTADVGESADLAIIPADDDHAFAEIFDRAPFARLRDFAFVADHLRRGAEERCLLRLKEFRVKIEPAGQAHAAQRVELWGDGAEVRGHSHPLPPQIAPVEAVAVVRAPRE